MVYAVTIPQQQLLCSKPNPKPRPNLLARELWKLEINGDAAFHYS
jgi:hypothetical protein